MLMREEVERVAEKVDLGLSARDESPPTVRIQVCAMGVCSGDLVGRTKGVHPSSASPRPQELLVLIHDAGQRVAMPWMGRAARLPPLDGFGINVKFARRLLGRYLRVSHSCRQSLIAHVFPAGRLALY